MSNVTARDVVDFWLSAGEDKWFSKDDAFDAEIKARFGEAVIAAGDGEYDEWAGTAEGALALVILLDQFPRNLHRGSADAFAYDARALAITRKAIEEGHDMAIGVEDRSWFYMPFMHSEALDDQERCIALVRDRLPDAQETLKFAILHRDLIAQFGRFPHRNSLFGRESTREEENYLSSDGAFSG